ncbi:hypothetical protein HG536_0H04590 [Torulaspora globosa]|uniref:VPS9 domain-containing protein n=1 Tax=Torulaspora globosa TaxID=48254 RepID=A0A7G3ZNJ7_9SACH|nr:uncharacterized protein HG536_0H04590 [Torulaspora globosa]QLL35083.1 hypothetical protein HG536_0H04590 [Torulaspora globosa]
MPYHLPVLLNPLVNAVFNCPNPSTSNLKKLFALIKEEKFILLIPPSDKLLNFKDKLTGLPLLELCYSFDFVASHVLLINESNGENGGISHLSQVKFDTVNGKKVLVRLQHRVALTSDGFQFKKRCKITDVSFIANFNDYLLPSDQFPVIYIDEPLCGELMEAIPSQQELKNERTKEVKDVIPPSLELSQGNKVSFENMLRIHPDWTSRFNSLFAEYRNTPERNGPDDELFHDIVHRIYSTMGREPAFKNLPDLFDLIYEYVELNLFDDIWIRITSHLKDNEISIENLENLSLNQLETELYAASFENFQLKKIVALEKGIELAMASFSRISLAHKHSEKSEALIETLRNLSNGGSATDSSHDSPMAMDADTLLSLFVLVVCRTQVKNLKAHLFYLQHFARNESTIKYGVLGYAISTLEAVVCHFEDLKGTERLNELVKQCHTNRAFVAVLSASDETPVDIDHYQGSLSYRTDQGESALSLCITNGKNGVLRKLLERQRDFPLEDILNDETTDGCTLLVQALRCGNSDAARIVVDLLILSCTEQELITYFNRPDRHKRISAHYLTHEVEILQKIGIFINWDTKDSSGHTALFTIFRSYDQANYEQMVRASFDCAATWYTRNGIVFDFKAHEDSKGNTLLHIMKKGISMLLKFDGIDVNATNKKGLTPLMVYAKYNRMDNIKAILKDNRAMIWKIQQPFLLDSLCYAKNPLILHELAKHAANLTFGKCLVHTLKYEAPSWLISVTSQIKQDGQFRTTELHLKTIQNFFRTFQKMNPMTFIPLDSTLDPLLSSLGKTRLSTITKLETMILLRNITNCISALIHVGNLPDEILSNEATLLSWIKTQVKASRDGSARPIFNKKVEPEEMSIIQSFLRFNQAELSALKTKLQVMKKLAIFLRLKATDVVESNKLLFSQAARTIESFALLSTEKQVNCRVYGDGPMVILAEEINFLLQCTLRLHGHISNLLQVRIPDWWKSYGELLSLHKQYAQNFPQLVKEDNSSMDSGILGRLLEGKREKLEKRLSFSIAETRRNMNQAGADIARLHEDLAEQLNKFMEYKGAFFCRSVIKKWTTENILTLKDQLLHLERDS